MNESFYCKCGNRGPDGGTCQYRHSDFAFQQPPKSMSLIIHIVIGAVLGLIVGSLIIAVSPKLGGYLAIPCLIIGAYLGNKKYNRRGGNP